MKIYFLGAISGRDKYNDVYVRIVRKLKRMHHDVESDHILKREPNKRESYPEPDHRKYVESVKKAIKDSDIVFAEVSHFTSNMGYEISYALENEVPVIAYCQLNDDLSVSPFLVGNTHPLFTFHRYSDLDLEDKIKDDMLYMTGLANKQFTFIVSPGIKSYLDWNFKTRKISRGLFIRLLIEQYIEKDQEYQALINTSPLAHE